jgi:hypothetical protein
MFSRWVLKEVGQNLGGNFLHCPAIFLTFFSKDFLPTSFQYLQPLQLSCSISNPFKSQVLDPKIGYAG